MTLSKLEQHFVVDNNHIGCAFQGTFMLCKRLFVRRESALIFTQYSMISVLNLNHNSLFLSRSLLIGSCSFLSFVDSSYLFLASVPFKSQKNFKSCMCCLPISGHVMSSWEFSFCFCHQLCVHLHVHKTTFESNYSLEQHHVV